jgi:hypothetical protein
MATAWDYLERLARYPHRGTATPEERAAALEMKELLEGLGYEVRLQPLRTPRDTLYLGPAVVMAGFILAILIGLRWPWVGVVLAVAFLLPLIGELLGSSRLDLDWLLPRYPSQNVVAVSRTAEPAARTLVISAHIDTQRASWLFHPGFSPYIQHYFTLAYVGLAAVPVVLILRWLLPGAGWTTVALGWLAGFLGVNILALLYGRLTGRYINGANDNGTGVALVMALADHFARAPVPGTRFIFLLTGAEETGTRGMKQFMRECRLDRDRTWFINLDNLGGGVLHYLRGEGMVVVRPYDAGLVGLARELGETCPGRVRPKGNLLLPTDGLRPALAGYPAISFLAFQENGRLPNYHWYTDTLAQVDRELLAFTEQFLVDYIRRLAGPRAVAETVAASRQDGFR